jgi:cyclophilin family peptidyl-prolyl cis-trans isomerase
MPSEKRRRQDEARLNKQFEQQVASKRTQRNRGLRNIVILLVVLAVAGGLYALVSGGSDKDEKATTSRSTSTTAAGGDIDVKYPGGGAALTGATPCPKVDGSSARTTQFAQAPPTCIDPSKTYTATLATSQGDITVDLDAEDAPIAVNNFVVLARYHFYDGVPFHRIVPGFVDQAGTPVSEQSAEGQKTPGYTIKDELPDPKKVTVAAEAYPEGTLAVANTGSPNTGSSQFFIVIGSGGQQLSLSYTPFGKVTGGLDVAKKINQYGDGATNGTPTKQITIDKVTITER